MVSEIHYDVKYISCAQLIDAVEEMGFLAKLINKGEDRDKVSLNLKGVHSTEEIKIIELSLQASPGVKSVEISPNGDKLQYGMTLTLQDQDVL